MLVASTGEEVVRMVKERARVTKDAAHIDLVRPRWSLLPVRVESENLELEWLMLCGGIGVELE